MKSANSSYCPLTLTEWTLIEEDDLAELSLIETGVWVNETVIIPSQGQIELGVTWHPLDDEIDNGSVTFKWAGGEQSVEVTTGRRGELDQEVEGQAGMEDRVDMTP